jgi:hypothetical protein
MTHQLEISGFLIRQIGTLTAVRPGATAVGQRGWIFDERVSNWRAPDGSVPEKLPPK